MPKKPMDYSKTIMYKLVCKDLLVTDKYVGHTTDFVKRKCNHKSVCNNQNTINYNLKIYQIIRDNGDWDNWEMIEIEKYPCNDANEAKARERYWIETFNSTLNMFIPNRTQKEYKQTNKEQITKYQNKYNEISKEKKQQQIICECGSIFRNDGKNRHLTSKKHINFNNSHINHFPPAFHEHIVETELVIDLP